MHLTLRPLYDFSAALAGRNLLAVGVGPSGRLASLLGEQRPGDPASPNELVIPGVERESTTVATAGLIWDGADNSVREVPLEPVRIRFPIVQPLPDGGLLIAGSRVAAGEEPNAVLFDPTGQPTRRILFGDGIEHVQVDEDGKAWVGYFDEGIFGDHSIGSSGLNRFDLRTGLVDWSFAPPPGADWIADCYALNVANDAVWVSYYPHFDLIRIDRAGSAMRWATSWSGARALATDGQSVLFVGTYREPIAASVQHLSDGTLTDARRVVLDRSDGRLPGGQLMARGDKVYAADGARWFAASIGEITSDGQPHRRSA